MGREGRRAKIVVRRSFKKEGEKRKVVDRLDFMRGQKEIGRNRPWVEEIFGKRRNNR